MGRHQAGRRLFRRIVSPSDGFPDSGHTVPLQAPRFIRYLQSMKSWCFLLLSLLAFVAEAWSAPILIYKGTGKQIGKNDGVISGPVGVYVVVDTATRQVGLIYFYQRSQQKFLFDLEPTVYRRVVFPLDSGKTSGVYNQTFALEANDEYLLGTRTLRGTYTGLKINSQAVIPFLHPKTLSGVEIIFANTETSELSSELRFNVTFQQKRTIEANDANQTTVQAFNTLVAELKDKGF
jgi:hypothetical protein